MKLTSEQVQANIAKGWKPNLYLTNMSVAYFQKPEDFIARKLFPLCPVQLSTSNYYKFSRADLARDNVHRKPAFGAVAPAIFSESEDTYKCEVDQIRVGIDSLKTLNYQRTNAPGMIDPRRAKVRLVSESLQLHLDLGFASAFFNENAWTQTKAGVAATPGTNQFLRFSDSNFDPVHFFNDLITDMKQNTRRRPNKLALGVKAYNALCEHGDIIDRVKYSGSTPNPAIVNANVLAQLLGLEEVVVLESTYNSAGEGKEDMKFVCNPCDALLCYANPTPAVDEPSAGYIFTWDMLGNGQFVALDQYPGENGTHAEFIEGLISTDAKKVCDDLGVYLDGCVE